MALKCLIGPSQTWDAVAYVRAQIEDLGPTFLIPDATLALYVEVAAEEFSKWLPLGEHVVGNFAASTPSSPLSTQAGVTRYSCSVGNGFLYPVMDIVDVLFKPSGIFNAANEYAYMALMPTSPYNWFYGEGNLLSKPSERIIRAAQFQELDHYSNGFWGTARDASGLPVIDIFPTPMSAGSPIFVRYTSSHIAVADGLGNSTYPSVPENLKRYFGKFLLIEVLEQEIDRLSRSSQLKAGQMQRWSTPGAIKSYANDLKADIEAAMGSSVTIGIVSH